jgi:hypothetical protein
MAQNKIITSVSAIVDNVISPTENNVVCIDTRNSRIGVKKSIPLYEIDVSGTINIDGSLTNGPNTLDSSGISTNSITIGNTKISTNSSNFSGLANFAQITCASGNFPKCTINDCSITNLTCTTNFFVKSIKPNIGTSDISINGNLVFDSSVNKITTTNLQVRNITNISGSNISISGSDISINGNVWIDGSLNIRGSSATATTITGLDIITGFINLRSDDRLKQNEEAIVNALLIIRKLNPQIYMKTANFMALDYRGPLDMPYTIEAGLIAQEVEKIDELKFSVIRGNEQTPYSINYNSIFIYCLAALKELDTNVETIKNVLNLNSTSNSGTSNSGTSNSGTSNSGTSNSGTSNNGTSNPDLINIINNQNIQIQELINKISILENRISNIEKAF